MQQAALQVWQPTRECNVPPPATQRRNVHRKRRKHEAACADATAALWAAPLLRVGELIEHGRLVPVDLLHRRQQLQPCPGADVAWGEPSPGADVAAASPVPVSPEQRCPDGARGCNREAKQRRAAQRCIVRLRTRLCVCALDHTHPYTRVRLRVGVRLRARACVRLYVCAFA
jgi:hypothetical protein